MKGHSATVWVASLLVALTFGCSRPVDQSIESQPSQIWFSDETDSLGVSFQHQSGHRDRKHLLPEITGSGVALVDVNNDGWLDLFLVQSGSLYEEDSEQHVAHQLYFNRGDGTFQLHASFATNAATYGMGVAAADFDNDGDNDLYITAVGRNTLLENNGSGRFVDVTERAGVGDEEWGTSAAFLDLDKDGDLDLYHANYLYWSMEIELDCFGSGVLTYCPPNNYQAPAIDRVYRNNGDGTFTEIVREAGIHLAFGNGFGVIGADFDDNGFVDVFVANDLTVNQLWMNQGNLQFLEEAMTRGSGVDGFGAIKAGMGVVSADPDQDGDYDILVVNLTGEPDSFFRNEGSYFIDSTSEVGLSAPSRRYTRFGVIMADFDNDGWLDLFHANGGVSPVDLSAQDIYAEPNSLFRGTASGRFEEVSPPGGTLDQLEFTSRGTAVGDIDNDGGLDLVVVNKDASPNVLMNRNLSRGNWIGFRLVNEVGSDAVGANISFVQGTRRKHGTVRPEGSYLSSNDPRVHFGLGLEQSATDVRVRWPTGEVEGFGDFEAGQYFELIRGEGEPIQWLK